MFRLLFGQKPTDKKSSRPQPLHKKRYYSAAEDIYAQALKTARSPVFYTHCDVPDTFDGRFEMLVLHVFLTYQNYRDHEGFTLLSQTLFDVTFKDMDQTMREMGIGDMGIPKHMKRMMKGFNGRVHAYSDSCDGGVDHTKLEDALRRNVYGTCEEGTVSQEAVDRLIRYIAHHVQAYDGLSHARIDAGDVMFDTTIIA